jgi:hypothetical protein
MGESLWTFFFLALDGSVSVHFTHWTAVDGARLVRITLPPRFDESIYIHLRHALDCVLPPPRTLAIFDYRWV